MIIKVLFALLALFAILPFAVYYAGEKKAGRFKRALAVNLLSFFGILIFTTIFIFSGSAYAASNAPDTASAAAAATASAQGTAYLAAALVTGMCTIGTGIATGQAAAAALGAISEKEGIMGKALILVSLCEGIAIYGLLVSFAILGRV